MTRKLRNAMDGFVADGCMRAWRANEWAVRLAVERNFTAQLTPAPFWRRLRLRFKMRREINRRLDEIAPPNALY